MNILRPIHALLAAFLLALWAPAGAAEADWRTVSAAGPAHVADLSGPDRLAYSVSWSELRLDPEAGDASATISATDYRLACACAPDSRPVLFLFNGGPGASSSPLHFSMGPRRRLRDGTFPENPFTLLRAADLVFIDPVETGFSRAGSPEGAARYLGVEGDVTAAARFVHTWLARNDRLASPVFLVGQSYGASRLARMTGALGGLDVRGLVMISPALDSTLGQSDGGHVSALPTLAATAWRFGRSAIVAGSETEAWETARAFAETRYLMALQQGDRISAAEKAALAGEIAGMTGLAADAVLAADLRIDIQSFLETLLADEGLLISRLNTARTSPLPAAAAGNDRPPAANDPALGLGRSNMNLAPDIAAYLEEAAGLVTDEAYRSLNLDANFAWDWRGPDRSARFYVSAAPALSAFMQDNPQVRLLVLAGLRDLATPLLGTVHTLSHAGLPAERTELMVLEAGHSPYDEDSLRPLIARRLSAFLGATPPPP